MKKIAVITCIILLLTVCVVVFAAPGTEDDPLVSLSYLNDRITELKSYIDGKATGGTDSSGTSESFVVISVEAGKSIIGEGGAEMILRQGTSSIIAVEKGGLANATTAYDMKDGEPTPPNCLLIVPLSDGRGLKAETDMLVMVKGGYEIK